MGGDVLNDSNSFVKPAVAPILVDKGPSALQHHGQRPAWAPSRISRQLSLSQFNADRQQ